MKGRFIFSTYWIVNLYMKGVCSYRKDFKVPFTAFYIKFCFTLKGKWRDINLPKTIIMKLHLSYNSSYTFFYKNMKYCWIGVKQQSLTHSIKIDIITYFSSRNQLALVCGLRMADQLQVKINLFSNTFSYMCDTI